MNWVVSIYTALLFFILVPGILLRLPPKGKLITVAIVHAIVFALIFHFTSHFVWKLSSSYNIEGARSGRTLTKPPEPCVNEKNKVKEYINKQNAGIIKEYFKCQRYQMQNRDITPSPECNDYTKKFFKLNNDFNTDSQSYLKCEGVKFPY